MQVDLPYLLVGVWGSAADDIYAVGGGRGRFSLGPPAILHYDGTQWSEVFPGAGVGVTVWDDVWGTSATDVHVVGKDAGRFTSEVILHFDGTGWAEVDREVRRYAPSALWGTSSSDVFAVGNGGRALHYDGLAWTVMVTPSSHGLLDVWGSSPTNVSAVGGTVLRYNGVEWRAIEKPGDNTFRTIWGSSASDVILGGDGGIIWHGSR